MNIVSDNTNVSNVNRNQSQNINRQGLQGTIQSPIGPPQFRGLQHNYHNSGHFNPAVIQRQERNSRQGQQRNVPAGSSQYPSNQEQPRGQIRVNLQRNSNSYNRQMRHQNYFAPSLAYQRISPPQQIDIRERSNLRQSGMHPSTGINNHANVETQNNPRMPGSQSRTVFVQPDAIIPSNLDQPRSRVQNVHVGFCKMDRMFAQCFKSLRYQHIGSGVIGLTFLMALLFLYKFKVFKGVAGCQFGFDEQEEHLKFSVIPFLIAFQSLILICQLYYIVNGFFSLRFALQTAQKNRSASSEQPADLSASFNQNVSTSYLSPDSRTYYSQQTDDRRKKLLWEYASFTIEQNIKDQFCCSQYIMQVSRFAMLIGSIVTIVALAQGHTTWLQKLILITTIAYWILVNYKKIYYIGLILACPCLSIIILIYIFVFDGMKKDVQIPQSKNPTQQQIFNSGGTCTICMMQFDVSDSVVTMPCSEKHMFHQICINGWLSVKTTCPICRYDLTL